MKILYVLLLGGTLTILDLIYLKIFQLENYKIKKYIKNILKFNFSLGTKNNLKYTKRVQRAILFNLIFNFFIFLFIFIFTKILWIKIVAIISVFLLSSILEILVFVCLMPVEECIKNSYIQKAKKKLKNFRGKKIAITGSYGKTSTKNILYQILRTEFDVCATPKSFNTPMGVCKTVLEDLKETDDFFVVEMGARKSGDIDFLSKFVGVDFGIITPIGNCHLETFGSIENIENTKYELCQNATSAVVFNGKSDSSRRLYDRFERKKYLVCEQGSFAFAHSVKTCKNGSMFILNIDRCEIKCQTNLLGGVNIDNIVVASAMAYLLGVSLLGIQKAIKNLKPIPHRLELIKGFVNVIDDSYNSNFNGFCEALKVLSTFSGKRVVVSPGIVELGREQKQINRQVASLVAKCADCFVIMNETNRKSLLLGALDGGMKRENIYFAKSRKEQQEILKNILSKGDSVLFENDFPDNLK